MGILPDEIKPAMQGVFPSHVVTWFQNVARLLG